jgi:hypothetical protein
MNNNRYPQSSASNNQNSASNSASGGPNPSVEHKFLSKMTDISSNENGLMKLLQDFSNNRLKKNGVNDIHDNLFKKMDAVREKQEKIARNHFEQDVRLTESK